MSFAIRRIGPQNIDLFDNIAADVFDEPVHPERLLAYLSAPGHIMVLALDGHLVVGQCAGVVHHHPDKVSELYVDEVGTATGYLRRGIATGMLENLFAWGREMGCKEAWLGTELDNVEANGLYRKFGGTEDEIKYYEFKL